MRACHSIRTAGAVRPRTRQTLALLILCGALFALVRTPAAQQIGPLSPTSDLTNVVTDWAAIVQPAIHNASVPRPPASSEILHTTIQLAVYDAAIAIEGGYEPYATAIGAPAGADVRAAVATAAYRTARARVHESQFTYLDEQYTAYITQIPDGQAKTDGTQVGEDAAAGVLALRANDGFNNSVLYQCSVNPPPPGEFEPNGGCGTQPVDAVVGQIRPFTFHAPASSDRTAPHR